MHTTPSLLAGRESRTLLITLFLVSALCQVDRILPFILAESIKRDLGLSDTEVGLITGVAFAVCNSLMSLPLARLADRGSPRWVLILCVLVWSAMTVLGGLSVGLFSLAFTRIGVALGEAGATPAAHALIARKTTPERRGTAIAIYSLGIPLGTMLGFAVGGRISDTLGWRAALFGAGAIGMALALLVTYAVRPTPPPSAGPQSEESYWRSALQLLRSPSFLWLFLGANVLALGSAPFYAFVTPFLIRMHGFTASEAGLAFGLPQGLMGILGMVLGGRGFDRAMQEGRGQLLRAPALVFLASAFTTVAALLAPVGWMSVALLVPAMFAFSFLLPWAFGAAHFVAGEGKQALASSFVMIGAGLLGPTLGPLIVGMVSDAATSAQLPDGLRWGMLLVPVAIFVASITMLVANRSIVAMVKLRGAAS